MTSDVKKKSHIQIGKIGSPHGLRGELYGFFHSHEWIFNLQKPDILKQVLLVKEGQECFSLLESVRPYKKGLLIQLKQIQNRSEAQKFQGSHIHLPLFLLKSQPGEKIYLHEVLHFAITTKEGFLGSVVGFSSNGVQDLLLVETTLGIKEIPFIDNFISSLSFEGQCIEMDLPKDLVDL